MKKQVLLLLLTCIQVTFMLAQNYPVRVTPQVIPPYATNLSGYANPNVVNSPVKAQLILNDITSPSRNVRLEVSIIGNGIQAKSTPVVIGAPNLTLDAGIPLQLTIAELAPYFERQNLQGISSAQYNSSLPDGSYQFCFDVFDVRTGNRMSRTSCATIFLITNDPPFLNKPENESRITEHTPTNILFQWTPRHINVPNVSYEFSIVEVWDTYINPQAIFVSSPPLYQETTTNTTLLYGPMQPLLLPGKRYAWRVRAFTTNNGEEVSVFNNYGNSEIFWFDYQKNCEIPTSTKVEDVQLNRATISWTGHPNHLDYTVHYRESGSKQWYTKTTPREYITIDEFKPDTVYEYKIAGNCAIDSLGESPIENFRTVSEEVSDYTACGIEADPVDLSNQELRTEVYPNDIFTAGDFPVYIKKVTSSGGSFTGEGYISTPWLATVRIPVTFENIKINTDNKMVVGVVSTTYDPNWDSIIDADAIIEEIVGDDGDIDVIRVDADITDVQVAADGSITLITSDGTKIEQPGGQDVVYVDKTNETWSVSEDGKVTKGQMAEGGPATSGNTNGVGSGGVKEITSTDITVEFIKSGYYSYDKAPENAGGTLADQYDKVPIKGSGSYAIPYKAVSNIDGHSSDSIKARATYTNSEYTKEDIVFKTKEGIKIPPTRWNDKGDVVTLSLKKQFDFGKQQIIATIKPKDTAQKYEVAGVANLWHLASQEVTGINVTIVRVNNAEVSPNLQDQINAIYNPAGVHFNIPTEENLTIDKSIWDHNDNDKLDIGDSGVLAHYTEEERAIKNYFKTQTTYNPETYYVFVLGKDMPPSKQDVKGFMPLKRQYGFIFGKKDQVNTIAHELGHGVFGLEHPSTEYGTTKGATDLLMDYNGGTAFTHMDWEKMHAPGIQLYLFQDDEDGEQISTDLEYLKDFANRDKDNKIISYSFITPSNKVVTLPPNVTDVNFSTYDAYYKIKSKKYSGSHAPMGSLLGFTLDKKYYSFRISENQSAYISTNDTNNKELYRDVYTKNIENLKDAIIALPYYNTKAEEIELYVNKMEIEASQIRSKTKDVTYFGAISYNFSVVKDFNNPKSVSGGYYLPGTHKGKQIKDVDYIELTPFAERFLESFSEDLVKDGSMFAPIIISSAFIFSNNEALEKLIECEVIDITNNQKRSLTQIQKSSKRFVPLLSLLKTFRTGDSHLHREAQFKQLLDYYFKLRELLKFPSKVDELHKTLNAKLSATTMTPAKMVELVNNSTSCALENITFENRINAIKKLAESHNTFFDSGEEKAMVNLLSAVTYNGQAKQLLTELFKKDNAKLFRKILKHTNFSNHEKYINKITEIYKIDKTGIKPTKKISFATLEGLGEEYIDLEFNPKDGSLSIDFVRDPPFSSRERIPHKFDSLDELVEVTFPLNNSYIKYKKGQTKDITVQLPAYYLEYLINKHNKDELMTAVRVLGNLVAIITAVPTGGQSITLVSGVSAAIASADMVMVFSEETLNKTEDGKKFVKIWSVITMIEGGVGLSKLGIAMTKKGANAVTKISFDFKKFDNIKDLSIAQREKILGQIRKIPGLLSKLGNTTVKTMFATKILSKLEASLLNASLTTITQAKLKITDWTQGSIALGGKVYELLKISHSSKGAFSKFLNIRKTTKSSDELIGALDDIRYQKPNSNSILEGDVAIYKTADDVVCVRALNSDSRMVEFLKFLENNPSFKANYDGLSKELQTLFRNDFMNASDDVWKALNKKNSALFQGWKNLRKNNLDPIFCK